LLGDDACHHYRTGGKSPTQNTDHVQHDRMALSKHGSQHIAAGDAMLLRIICSRQAVPVFKHRGFKAHAFFFLYSVIYTYTVHVHGFVNQTFVISMLMLSCDASRLITCLPSCCLLGLQTRDLAFATTF